MPSQSDPTAQTLLGHLTDTKGAHELSDLTVNGVPADAALAAQYAPKTGSDQYAPLAVTNAKIFIPAQDFQVYLGAPTFTASTLSAFWATWLLNIDGSGEGVSSTFHIPDGWTTMSWHVWHALPASGTGNFRMLGIYNNGVGVGQDQALGAAASISVIPAGALNTFQRTLVVSGISVTPGRLGLCRIARVQSASADTLTPDIAFLGVEITGNPT